MPPEPGKCSKIRHIVRIRQMLLQWRKKARIAAVRAPFDVPAGHVSVYVGPSSRRFIVRATYLNHPIFKNLLVQAEEEYGFCNQGPLTLPCEESLFEEVLRAMSGYGPGQSPRYSSLEDFQKRCHMDVRSNYDFVGESRPLLYDEPIC